MWLPVFLVVLTVFNYNCPKHGHSYREFGSREDGDVLSYEYKGIIPLFHPILRVLVKPQRRDVEDNFTYLRVEYINKVTKVVVLYNATAQMITFRLKFPFIRIPFEVTGYSRLLNSTSKPLNETGLLNSTSKLLNETRLVNFTFIPINQTIRSFKWDLTNLYDLIKDLI